MKRTLFRYLLRFVSTRFVLSVSDDSLIWIQLTYHVGVMIFLTWSHVTQSLNIFFFSFRFLENHVWYLSTIQLPTPLLQGAIDRPRVMQAWLGIVVTSRTIAHNKAKRSTLFFYIKSRKKNVAHSTSSHRRRHHLLHNTTQNRFNVCFFYIIILLLLFIWTQAQGTWSSASRWGHRHGSWYPTTFR